MSNYQTILETFGGSAGIHDMAFVFHQKLLKDQYLRRYFRHLDIDDFVVLQQEFFEVALGKAITRKQGTLEQVRRGFGIEQEDFPRFAKHIIDTLKAKGVAAKDQSEIMGRVTAFAETITGMSYGTQKATPASSSTKPKNTTFKNKEVQYESSCI